MRVLHFLTKLLALVNGILKCLTSSKLHRLSGRNLYLCTSLWIAPYTSRPLTRLKGAKANQLNIITFSYNFDNLLDSGI